MIHARIQEFSSGGGRGGGGVQVHLAYKKALTTLYLFICFSPQFILQKSSGYFQRKLLFAKVPVGVEHFPGGGVQLFTGVSNCFFPIETHITCDFPGGSGPPAPPPLALPM